MPLSLENLASMGAFTGALVEREITWRQGAAEHRVTVFVRPLSYLTTVTDLRASRDDSDPVAARIAASICNAEGKPVFTVGDITGDANPERGPLNDQLALALLVAIGEVNQLGKTKRSAS
ncbi:phage tail assembly chaperone family protein, TAC [Pseudomonas tohonis]|uniref:phage tail assembly chaperone family protein, TAC n=1 Tax=Pseudomonas tohonis TaxID=2725477 RepID=UPI002FDC8748